MPLYKRAGLFNPHETHLEHSLAGTPLAPFSRRFWAFAIDGFLLALINIPSKVALQYFIEHKLHLGELHQSTVLHLHVKAQFNMEMTLDLLWTAFLVLYFGLFFRFTNGLTAITDVVRGRDLLKSTARQILLQRALSYPTPAYFHCDLMRDSNGVRLAKRHDALALRTLRANGLSPADILAMF